MLTVLALAASGLFMSLPESWEPAPVYPGPDACEISKSGLKDLIPDNTTCPANKTNTLPVKAQAENLFAEASWKSDSQANFLDADFKFRKEPGKQGAASVQRVCWSPSKILANGAPIKSTEDKKMSLIMQFNKCPIGTEPGIMTSAAISWTQGGLINPEASSGYKFEVRRQGEVSARGYLLQGVSGEIFVIGVGENRKINIEIEQRKEHYKNKKWGAEYMALPECIKEANQSTNAYTSSSCYEERWKWMQKELGGDLNPNTSIQKSIQLNFSQNPTSTLRSSLYEIQIIGKEIPTVGASDWKINNYSNSIPGNYNTEIESKISSLTSPVYLWGNSYLKHQGSTGECRTTFDSARVDNNCDIFKGILDRDGVGFQANQARLEIGVFRNPNLAENNKDNVDFGDTGKITQNPDGSGTIIINNKGDTISGFCVNSTCVWNKWINQKPDFEIPACGESQNMWTCIDVRINRVIKWADDLVKWVVSIAVPSPEAIDVDFNILLAAAKGNPIWKFIETLIDGIMGNLLAYGGQ